MRCIRQTDNVLQKNLLSISEDGEQLKVSRFAGTRDDTRHGKCSGVCLIEVLIPHSGCTLHDFALVKSELKFESLIVETPPNLPEIRTNSIAKVH